MRKPEVTLALLALLAAAPYSAFAGNGPPAAPGGNPAPPAGAPAIGLDRAFMFGLWTDDNDCGDVVEFSPDGTFNAANGGTGRWALDGDRLSMSGQATVTLRIVPIDHDTITVVNEDGSLGRSIRCAARTTGHAPANGETS